MFKKAAEATGDSIGNKIADKIISMGKLKEKNKESRRNLHSARKKIKNNWWVKVVSSKKL